LQKLCDALDETLCVMQVFLGRFCIYGDFDFIVTKANFSG